MQVFAVPCHLGSEINNLQQLGKLHEENVGKKMQGKSSTRFFSPFSCG